MPVCLQFPPQTQPVFDRQCWTGFSHLTKEHSEEFDPKLNIFTNKPQCFS